MPTYQKVTIGQYEFQEVTRIEPVLMRPAIIAKLLGVNASAVVNWGTYGAKPYHFRGTLGGNQGKVDVATIEAELNRPDPVQLKVDIKSGKTAWGQILSFEPVEKPGYAKASTSAYDYDFDIVFIQAMDSDEGSRGFQFGVVTENHSFGSGITPTTIVPLLKGVSAVSETTTITRYIDDRAAGVWNIPCSLSPDLTQILYTATEADLGKGAVVTRRVGREYVLEHGSIRLQTMHDEPSNKGRVEVWYYNGTTWIRLGYIMVYIAKSGGDWRQITGSTKGPETWVLLSGERERQALRMKYPPTTDDALEAWLEIELDRNRPFFRTRIMNAGPTQLVKCETQLIINGTAFPYWTRGGVEHAAHGGGSEVVAGDTDAVNVQFLQSTSGAPVAASLIAAIARRKKLDSDNVAVDETTYYSEIAQRFDNVTIDMGRWFESVWFAGGRYDKIGSRTAIELAAEAMNRVTGEHTVIPYV